MKKKKPKAKPDLAELFAKSQAELQSCQLQLIGILVAIGRPVTVPMSIIQGIVSGVDYAVSWRDTTAAGDFLILKHERVIKGKDGDEGQTTDPGSSNGVARPPAS